MRTRRILSALIVLCLIALCAPVPGALADSKYYITVDLTNQIVTVYDSENTSDENIVRQMICSTGRTATPTPTGTYYLPSKVQSSERSEWYYFPKFKCYAKWATRIHGGILFHSTIFTMAKKGPTSASTRALGSKASHGCVRLRVDDAKFIAMNCAAGTKCRIFSSGKTNSKLRNKLKKKTFNRDKQTYDSYMGRKPRESTLPFSKGSTGTLVTQLQTRLKALGFHTGNANGTFDKKTISAVKSFEAAAGLKKTNTVNQALWDAIFADNAVTGTLVTLSEGSSGPAVSVLQSNLVTLLMLDGSVDGSFGSQTAAAVSSYQSAFGYTASGSADQNLQNEIASRAAQVRQDFGATPYALGTVTTNAQMAKVKAKSGVKLRKTASAKAKSLKKLKYKTAARVLSKGKTWTRLRYGDKIGYVKNSTLKYYTESVTENGYVQVTVTPEPTAEPTPTPTPEIYIPMAAAEQDGLQIEAAGQAVLAEAMDAALIYGTEPVETPVPEAEGDADDGFDLEYEPVPTPTPEPGLEAPGAEDALPGIDEITTEAAED